MKKLVRSLSQEGQSEFRHIFKDGTVPVTQITPIYAELQGHPEKSTLVFLVDWKQLSAGQQMLVVDYISKKFQFPKAHPSEIRRQLKADGYLPIQHKWVIESYDMRHFI